MFFSPQEQTCPNPVSRDQPTSERSLLPGFKDEERRRAGEHGDPGASHQQPRCSGSQPRCILAAGICPAREKPKKQGSEGKEVEVEVEVERELRVCWSAWETTRSGFTSHASVRVSVHVSAFAHDGELVPA